MKVLVLSNCSLQSYVAYLRAAHPAWDVRGVLQPQAKKFVDEKHPGFMEFLGQLDLFVGFTDVDFLKPLVSKDAKRIYVPRFSYFGLQPDAFFVQRLPSALGQGLAHSRLAIRSYLEDKTLAETEKLFNAQTFGECGYFDRRNIDRDALVIHFSKRGVDISDFLESWLNVSGFIYYPSHPKIQFFFDLLDLVMRKSGIAPEVSAEALQASRASLEDYLEQGVHWPIYPEIAAYHGIEPYPTAWRASSARGTGEQFGLSEMLKRAWTIYDAADRRDLGRAVASSPNANVSLED